MDQLPKILVVISDYRKNTCFVNRGYAEAHIRERIKGNGVYRYLVWRAGGKIKEFYLGKLTLRSIGSKSAAAKLNSDAPSKKTPIAPAGSGQRSLKSVG